jgi:hypothetical protein
VPLLAARRTKRLLDAAFDRRVNACALALLVVDDDATQLLTHDESEGTLTRELSQLESERYAYVVLRASDHAVRGLALLRTESSTPTDGCSPGLCAFVADVLGQLSVAV